MSVDTILLDTCCFVNLCASGYLASALQNDEWRYVLSGIVADEALYILQENITRDGGLDYSAIDSRDLATKAEMRIIEVGDAAEINL